MNPLITRTAVLLFTRPAGEEAACKSFGAGGRGADAAVAAQLIARATAMARQAGVDFLCVESGGQVGRTFGQRLAAALSYGFGRGYERLVVIGNDCPALTPALVRQAVRALETTDAVLGPALDGGVYLLGINRSFFESEAWAALPWQTAALGRALRQCLRQAGAACLTLRPLADVDNAHDLARALRQLPAGAFRRRLHRLRAAARPVAPALRPPRRPAAVAAPLPQRGPPIS
ncbi:TIGR04282 family arsenosugar biosynthesis glycosyltransferase [Hymenobacter rubripertinctus]|uniref:DUF2064 domain-containing protein n=1 Tax=Hymenobacter rubripertinctus TaxID=2029981 RepID=A0A418QX85_9BACT|nr:DUF2064 domain-containing protein [Hymenobacter rubripertinctus]RIY09790.1 DUF2064 domain-containing protein [Hymenobacter rubripertinctus]